MSANFQNKTAISLQGWQLPGSWRGDRLPLSTSNTAGLTLSCRRGMAGADVRLVRRAGGTS